LRIDWHRLRIDWLGDVGGRSLISYLDGVEQEMGIDTRICTTTSHSFQDSNQRLHRAGVLLTSRNHGIDLFSVVPPDNADAIRTD